MVVWIYWFAGLITVCSSGLCRFVWAGWLLRVDVCCLFDYCCAIRMLAGLLGFVCLVDCSLIRLGRVILCLS